MARKRRSGPDELLALLFRLPGRLSILIGFVSWLVLSRVAAIPLAAPDALGYDNLTWILIRQLGHAFATVGQYLVPLVFVLAAVGSFIRRRDLQPPGDQPSSLSSVIDGLSWQEFEQLIGQAFRTQGFSVSATGGQGTSNLVLYKNGEKYLVQCKHWRAALVGVPEVRECLGAMLAEGAAVGMLVTSGQFSAGARKFADGCNIQLIDGDTLKGMLPRPRQPISEH